MTRKRLTLTSLLGVVVIILGVLPYFFGDKARETLEQQAAVISDIPGYALVIKDYEQGWFTSHVVFNFGFDAHTIEIMEESEAQNDAERVLLDLLKAGADFEATVAHGPVTFQNGLNFALLSLEGRLKDIDSQLYQDFRKLAGVPNFLNFHTVIAYNGVTTADVTSPAFKAALPTNQEQQITIESGGLTSHTTVNADVTHYVTEAKMPLFKFEATEGGIMLKDMYLSMQADRLNDYLWLGQGETEIGEITALVAGKSSFSLKNLKTTHEINRESDDTLQASLKMTLSQAGAGGNNVTDGILDLTFNRLDIDGLTRYVEEIQAISLTEDDQPPLTEEEIAQKTMDIISRTGFLLAQRSPEMSINSLKFKFGEGNFAGIGTVALKGEGLKKLETLNDPQTLLSRLAVDLTAGFDQALAEAIVTIGMKQQMAGTGIDMSHLPEEQLQQAVNIQTTLMLQTYVNQGLIVVDEENGLYNAHIEIKNGQQLINGKPLDIPLGQ
ncbi:YdgA family protein [Luteithermobacter gelatinilyticus]|uniref:YdgA family protein n=1 Tax=Luteithermobacter gelatinilyticus TaxID=2582913 RepID=UPI0011069B26|nr:YdgA family protein [Luteithermobacter gelatinilyticus]